MLYFKTSNQDIFSMNTFTLNLTQIFYNSMSYNLQNNPECNKCYPMVGLHQECQTHGQGPELVQNCLCKNPCIFIGFTAFPNNEDLHHCHSYSTRVPVFFTLGPQGNKAHLWAELIRKHNFISRKFKSCMENPFTVGI